jgi:uncharacterized protein
MTRMIFVNLPVADLARSVAFYTAIGARPDPRFTDETAAAVSFSEAIHLMLLTHDKWRTFTPRPIADPHRACEVMVALSAESREDVLDIARRASQAGGRPDPVAPMDFGWMLHRSFEDPDGHIVEVMWMDVEAAMAAGSGAG